MSDCNARVDWKGERFACSLLLGHDGICSYDYRLENYTSLDPSIEGGDKVTVLVGEECPKRSIVGAARP